MNWHRTSRFLVGLSAGLGAGYGVYRAAQALGALRNPRAARRSDARAYGSLRRRLEVAATIRSLLGAYAFAAGAAPALNGPLARVPEVLRPAALAAASSAFGFFAELGIAVVEDFELERRFGLSEQTARAWFADHLKGALIGAVFLGVLSVPFGWVLRRFPHSWPLAATAGLAPVFVAAGVVVPVYLAPLFNTFAPLEGALERRLRRLASRYGAGNAAILRVDMSRQTKKANAYVTGLFGTHRIVVGDTLLQSFEDGEIEFVVAHELGHYVARDSWRMTAIGVLLAASMFGLSNALVPRAMRERYADADAICALYVRMVLVSAALRPAVLAFARSREWAADRFALRATGDGTTGAAAFRRLREQNLAEEVVPLWYEMLFSTHPALGARIERLAAAG